MDLLRSKPVAQPWFLYVLECCGGSLYTGVSNDVDRRFAAHCRGKGARYTRLHPPERIALRIVYPDKSSALKAEHAFKALSAPDKRRFIALHGGN